MAENSESVLGARMTNGEASSAAGNEEDEEDDDASRNGGATADEIVRSLAGRRRSGFGAIRTYLLLVQGATAAEVPLLLLLRI